MTSVHALAGLASKIFYFSIVAHLRPHHLIDSAQ